MWVDLMDGRTLGVPLACLPRLLAARADQRSQFEVSSGGTGLHWMLTEKPNGVETAALPSCVTKPPEM